MQSQRIATKPQSWTGEPKIIYLLFKIFYPFNVPSSKGLKYKIKIVK